MPQGVAQADFDVSIFPDWKVTVSRTPVTKTLDPISGDETLSDGTPANIDVIFLRRSQKWMFDKEGLIEGGDAYILAKSTTSLNKEDKITYNGDTYRVQDLIIRYTGPPDNDVIYKYANLFLI